MTITKAIHKGAQTLGQNKRMLLLFWLLNLMLALFAAAPVAATFARDLGHSAYAASLMGNFDIAYLSEFAAKSSMWPLTAAAPALLLVLFAYMLANTFLAAGALSIFTSDDRKYSAQRFFEGCGRFFWPLTGLLLVFLVASGVALGFYGVLGRFARAMWGDGMELRPLVFFGWFRSGFTLLLLLLLNLVFDYSRIIVVASNQRNPLRAAIDGFHFVRGSLRRTISIYSIILLFSMAISALYFGPFSLIPRDALLLIFAVIVVQQAIMVAKTWCRLMFWSSQAAYFVSVRRTEAVRRSVVAVNEPEEIAVGVAAGAETAVVADETSAAPELEQPEAEAAQEAPAPEVEEQKPGADPPSGQSLEQAE